LKHKHPLPIHHSWPLYESARHFEFGQLLGYDSLDFEPLLAGASPRLQNIGRWSCDLADNALSWSSEVYDIFGLPDGASVSRGEAVALYGEPSRAAMEKLRAYAIRHRRGFTLDAEIRPATGAPRWMRLIAAPVCAGDMVVKLQGLKFLLPDPPQR
jgi:PAS domain-containing protein